MEHGDHRDRAILEGIARRAMVERGLRPDYSAAALAELEDIDAPAAQDDGTLRDLRDLRDLPWCSIDNEDSQDLDQLTVAEALPGAEARILVAVADVDALVGKGSAIDEHAGHNTTSVYTPARVFSMIPEKLSTNLTSLNPHRERVAVVAEMVVRADGSLRDSFVYRARVVNHAKLAYERVAAWLDGYEGETQDIGGVEGLADSLRLQDAAAQAMKALRHSRGALELETIEARPVFDDGKVLELRAEGKNRARYLIEDLMIAVNGVTARFLTERGYPSIRRVVRTPRRWDRIVGIAAEHRFRLPAEPDAMALEGFLVAMKAAHPVQFPDLSLSVIKLLGPGEYVAGRGGDGSSGHFGLAVRDYAHSTAPNRRYTDLITQRLLKAALAAVSSPYSDAELDALAAHCTRQEDAANKVERQVGKSAAVLVLAPRMGEQFDAIVTGAAPKGTWVRLLAMPVEGRLVSGFEGLDVGGRTRVQLASVDVERGFIDFVRVGSRKPGSTRRPGSPRRPGHNAGRARRPATRSPERRV